MPLKGVSLRQQPYSLTRSATITETCTVTAQLTMQLDPFFDADKQQQVVTYPIMLLSFDDHARVAQQSYDATSHALGKLAACQSFEFVTQEQHYGSGAPSSPHDDTALGMQAERTAKRQKLSTS